MENVDLKLADLRAVDFTETKNNSLAGANLNSASFLLADLSGTNLSGVILANSYFHKTDLSDVNFTVLSNIPNGVVFTEATLTNSNFEGVTLSPIDFIQELSLIHI